MRFAKSDLSSPIIAPLKLTGAAGLLGPGLGPGGGPPGDPPGGGGGAPGNPPGPDPGGGGGAPGPAGDAGDVIALAFKAVRSFVIEFIFDSKLEI